MNLSLICPSEGHKPAPPLFIETCTAFVGFCVGLPTLPCTKYHRAVTVAHIQAKNNELAYNIHLVQETGFVYQDHHWLAPAPKLEGPNKTLYHDKR